MSQRQSEMVLVEYYYIAILNDLQTTLCVILLRVLRAFVVSLKILFATQIGMLYIATTKSASEDCEKKLALVYDSVDVPF
jgi:hypothetical protein